MKSDQEFLKGIYEKAKEMELSEEKEQTGIDSLKSFRRTVPFRYAVTAAAGILLVSAGIFWHDKNKTTEQITPQPMSIDVRGIDIGTGLENLIDSSADILEVKPAKSGENAYETLKVYKNSGDGKDIIAELTGKIPQLEESQTAIVFLMREQGSTEVLDSFISTKDGTYQNSFGETFTEEELLDKIEKGRSR